jgi:heme/copper-type cytochrome/quinol oxidase subunit 2
MWFDWQSRWTSIEVQPSSVARYSLLGVPYFSRNFEYATQQSDEINDSETYLLRLSKARKNYMSNWALTPYIYSRISNWYSINNYLSNTLGDTNVHDLRLVLELSRSYWQSNNITNMNSEYTPSITDINTPGAGSWKPTSSIQGFNYTTSTLVNILTKREYLYREYFLNKGFTVNLPKYLRSTPNNTLLEEVKYSYNFIDPSNFVTEVQRDFFYENTLSKRFNVLTNLIKLSITFNFSFSTNNIFYYLFNTDFNDNLLDNNDLYKNQFRPIRKGISNMIRLHATGAIAMPTEIRLHILASSKDIIHSWAIPGAGIKIDCVPGYSSHRVAIFLLSGIFWGQCMEICGRFHHWMPIVVYFMKRDMFFLWCTHFIHFSPSDFSFNTTDKEFSSRLRQVSFSGNWLY